LKNPKYRARLVNAKRGRCCPNCEPYVLQHLVT
jgi:hypothetical protein